MTINDFNNWLQGYLDGACPNNIDESVIVEKYKSVVGFDWLKKQYLEHSLIPILHSLKDGARKWQ